MHLSSTWARILAAIIAVAGVIIVATSGDSVSVRFLTLIVTVDIAVRLYAHSTRSS
jgi:drug/metabolite transporter (DMT)-like permease